MKNFIVLLLIFSLGCVSGSYMRTGKYYLSKSKENPISVFNEKPTFLYEVIGIVIARTKSKRIVSDQDLLEKLKNEARKLGADAIILIDLKEFSDSEGGIRRVYRAEAIKFEEKSGQVQ